MESNAENEKLVRGAVGIPLISLKSPTSTAMSSISAQGKKPLQTMERERLHFAMNSERLRASILLLDVASSGRPLFLSQYNSFHPDCSNYYIHLLFLTYVRIANSNSHPRPIQSKECTDSYPFALICRQISLLL